MSWSEVEKIIHWIREVKWRQKLDSHCNHNQSGSSLSIRQKEILQFAAAGYDNNNIAFRLGLTIKGIEYHLRKAFEKLGVKNRTEAVFVATDHKMIDATAVHITREDSF